jgi:hypothetical protein
VCSIAHVRGERADALSHRRRGHHGVLVRTARCAGALGVAVVHAERQRRPLALGAVEGDHFALETAPACVEREPRARRRRRRRPYLLRTWMEAVAAERDERPAASLTKKVNESDSTKSAPVAESAWMDVYTTFGLVWTGQYGVSGGHREARCACVRARFCPAVMDTPPSVLSVPLVGTVAIR